MMENKEQLFGTKARIAVGGTHVLKSFFNLQPVKFWIITYFVSFGIYQLFNEVFYLSTNILKINMIFFPFSVIIAGRIANISYLYVPWIYKLLYPSYKVSSNSSNLLKKLIVLVIKFYIYLFIWHFSFIIGTIGLIITMIDLQKLSK